MTALVELNPIDPGTGNRVTVRVCASQDPDLTGANGQIWWPAIMVQPVLAMTLFDGAFVSEVSAAQASMEVRLDVLRNSGAFPRAERYDWSGATAIISRLVGGSPVQLAVMRVESFASEADRLSLRLAVDLEPVEGKVLFSEYAGTTGLEGNADLKGKPKPWAFGRCLNVEPVFIDKIDNVYQVSAYGPVQAIPAVYERGASFGASVGNFANYAALVAADIPEGRWGTCLAQGLFRLGAPPAGVITCDVDGDNTVGFIRRTGAIIKEIARRLDVSSKVNATSLDALDAAVARNVNIYISQQTTLLDLAKRMAAPCNAVAGVALDGRLITSRVAFGSEQFTLDHQGREMPPVLGMARKNTSTPFDEIKLGAARSWRVHTFDEVAFYAELIDRGLYDPATIYREGNIVASPDKSRWLYINPTPTAGNGPPTWPTTSNAFWASLEPPLNATAIGVEEGATRTQTANANRVPFSRMERNLGWQLLFNPSALVTESTFGEVAGFRFLQVRALATAAGQFISLGQSGPQFRVTPGERLSIQSRVEFVGEAAENWQLELWLYEDDGVTQSAFVIASGSEGRTLGTPPVQAFFDVPAGRAFGRLELRVGSDQAGLMQIAIAEPMVTSALPGQTFHPPFTAGPNAFNGADVTIENPAAAIVGQGPWATFTGETPEDLIDDIATAQADAQIALTALNNIAADGVFDITEKQQVRQLRNDIVAEFPVWRDRAVALNVPVATRNAYQTAYDELIAFLGSVAIDSNVNTAMDRATFTARFNAYFSTRAAIFDGITNAASQIATTLPLGNANRVPFSRMEGDKGWALLFNPDGLGVTNIYGDVNGRRFFKSEAATTAAGQAIVAGQSSAPAAAFPCLPGERLSVQSVIDAVTVSSWDLGIQFVRADGTRTRVSIGSGTTTVFGLLVAAFVTVPTGGSPVIGAHLEMTGVSLEVGGMALAFFEPMVTSAAAEQTVHPPFSPGPNAFDAADVTAAQPIVGLLNPSTGRATSRRITSQLIAGGVLQTFDTNPLSSATSGGVSSITVIAHQVFDDAGTISFSTATIGGLSPSTLYYVYEENPDFIGGARTYVATTNRNDLTGFGRRYVGVVTTPADGASPGTGGGLPGGGWGGGDIP